MIISRNIYISKKLNFAVNSWLFLDWLHVTGCDCSHKLLGMASFENPARKTRKCRSVHLILGTRIYLALKILFYLKILF